MMPWNQMNPQKYCFSQMVQPMHQKQQGRQGAKKSNLVASQEKATALLLNLHLADLPPPVEKLAQECLRSDHHPKRREIKSRLLLPQDQLPVKKAAGRGHLEEVQAQEEPPENTLAQELLGTS
jgi:hypothetical protein